MSKHTTSVEQPSPYIQYTYARQVLYRAMEQLGGKLVADVFRAKSHDFALEVTTEDGVDGFVTAMMGRMKDSTVIARFRELAMAIALLEADETNQRSATR